jgi:Fe-S cluster biogenesis protein NfuA
MPKIAEIEPTPNPNAMKFILREPLTWGITRSYDSADQAREDPLASRLFAIEHVVNVFYVDHWITVTQDGKADWQELMRKLAVPIRDAPGADAMSERIAEQAAHAQAHGEVNEADRERLDRINAMLDEQVRPYLQGDGGDLYVVGLDGNTLSVHYQGACGSCPSSISGTLVGIENLLRQIEPDIEVVAA